MSEQTLHAADGGGYLHGLRVLEVADERGEYVGKVLAGLGADVVKVEPVGGESTRGFGPFIGDEPGLDRSLHFWHYNHGKRSVLLDLETAAGREAFSALAAAADVLIDAHEITLAARGIDIDVLLATNARLIHARITPFGDEGPWANYAGSDLIHLALGGIVMNCGYDPDPSGVYDTPPIAPQMWQSYHIAGEFMAMSILAAAFWRTTSGLGQKLSLSIHQAVSGSTELDIPHWNVLRQVHRRQRGRHSMPELTGGGPVPTKDGRSVLPYTTYVRTFKGSWPADIALLRKYGMQEDLDQPQWEDPEYRADHQQHIADVMARLLGRTTSDRELWREMLDAGQPWAPLRRPEENVDDEHWAMRGTFASTAYPEIGDVVNVASRWVADGPQWVVGDRAPQLGEHTDKVRAEWTPTAEEPVAGLAAASASLAGVRVIDLSWMLASAGAGRILASFGAEVIKIEHESHPDGMRHTRVVYPSGGRAERDAATAPIVPPSPTGLDGGGNFMEINSGKLSLALDLKNDDAKRVLEDLIRSADILTEGFSPGTLSRMGFSYERLKELNPRIIYIQQSGLGEQGTYGSAKAFGPTAQAFAGLTEMSGLPAPWPAAGIGYSYLDWFGAYNMATAALAALVHRTKTGEGCHIDASQVEIGLYLAGSTILDASVNGRSWSRSGNRSPLKPAAPHGIFPAAGDDRWIAIACFSDAQWTALRVVLGDPDWARDERFATLEGRVAAQDALERHLVTETAGREPFDLMHRLQAVGVPAGVAQTAEDRIDHDPQLRALHWQGDLPQTTNGLWPARTHPVQFSETPAMLGGVIRRHGPNYGEDTSDVLTRVLGYSDERIAQLRALGALEGPMAQR